MKNIIGIFVALFFATAAHAQLVLPGAGGGGGGGSPGGTSGQIQTNNGSGGFGALATTAALGHGSYATGRFYGTWPGGLVAGSNPGNNNVTFYSFFVSQTISITSLNIYVSVTGTGSSAMAGIYNDANGLPTGSSICTPSTSQVTTSIGNVAFPVTCTLTGPGWYWAAVNVSHTSFATIMSLGNIGSLGLGLGSYLMGASTAASANGTGSPGTYPIGYNAGSSPVVSGSMPAISSLTLSPVTNSGTVMHLVIGD